MLAKVLDEAMISISKLFNKSYDCGDIAGIENLIQA
jgi:hypothetical protein